MGKNKYIDAREEYIRLLRRELLGPGSEISIPDAEHELISTSPKSRYSMGILYPQGNRMNADNDEVENSSEKSDVESGESEVEEADRPAENTALRSALSRREPDEAEEDDESDFDESVGLASQLLPSSMGLTFFAYGESKKVCGKLDFGTYKAAKVKDCMMPYKAAPGEEVFIPAQAADIIEYDSETECIRLKAKVTRRQVREIREKDDYPESSLPIIDILFKLADQLGSGYVRTPRSIDFSLDFSDSDYYESNPVAFDSASVIINAVRRRISDSLYSVTVMVVNAATGEPDGNKCIFQPVITIGSTDNSFVFSDYSGSAEYDFADDEELSLAMQYRNKKVYGTGLGTALDWEIDSGGVGTIRTEFFPEYEVPSMDFRLSDKYAVDTKVFSMKYLSDLEDNDRNEKIDLLQSLTEAYKRWIDDLKERIPSLDAKYKEIAEKNTDGCLAAYNRMVNGIRTLRTDNNAWASFELANRAMFMQRVHIKLQEKFGKEKGATYPGDTDVGDLLTSLNYKTADNVIPDSYAWRPFQLAFLLLSIDSITEDDGEDRNIVDLIWFPTGGGKTEAYLGLTAFTIFYRRLAHLPESSGTAVIMRYTLRLLAAQQFTRASTLICACEHIRRDCCARPPKYKKYDLGKDEISIGLWIGGEHTPNRNVGGESSAKEHLRKLLDARRSSLRDAKDKHNKFQVLKCPWCGTKLTKDFIDGREVGSWGYNMRNGNRFYLACTHDACDFHLRLPIQVVDEELYKQPPTLLFGTVDKFAMLPWLDTVGAFFATNSLSRTPELIIQDELHLISGPLGTVVGLYEAAVDAICRAKGVPTKIIASTATIRRAKQQCAALYDRDVLQFPHPGIDAEDSFFARESVIDLENDIYGRKYIGLMASGKTKAMMEVRTLAALLQQMHNMDLPDEIKDKYWTVTAYFNSLKDLGKCSTLLDDDVKDFIKRISRRGVGKRSGRAIGHTDELTSRASTTELNETLDKLEKTEYKSDPATGKVNTEFASNTLVATNMISVGIDVARLNVMLLVGQPKLTSEYIQASSRVGRSFPGMALALYEGTKSRDRSHYEQFRPYHEAFYKFVEPTGVTPFSGPARERALHGVVFSLMRHRVPALRAEESAGAFSRARYAGEIAEIKEYILNRNSSVIKRLGLTVEDESAAIADEIDTCFEIWENLASRVNPEQFFYGKKFMFASPEHDQGRLLKAYNTAPGDDAIDTMTSMRNVDTTAAGSLIIWREIK